MRTAPAKTFTPIESSIANKITPSLATAVLDLIELRSQVKLAHWNSQGANFLEIHKFLDSLAEVVDKATDEIAERIRQLGASVDAPTDAVARKAGIPDFPKGLIATTDAVHAVCKGIASTVELLRDGIRTATETVDEPITADLLTGIVGQLELNMWLLSSHLNPES